MLELSIQNPKDHPFFDLIDQEVKTVEGRANKLKYHNLHQGDIIIIKCENGDRVNERFEVIITSIKKYINIKEYLEVESLEKTLPGVKTIEEGMNIYHQFNTEDDINKLAKRYFYGFIALHLKKI